MPHITNRRKIFENAALSRSFIYTKTRRKIRRVKYCLIILYGNYIIPPIPPAPACGSGFFEGISATTASVVRNVEATDVAF